MTSVPSPITKEKRFKILDRRVNWDRAEWWWYDSETSGPNTYAEFYRDFELPVPPHLAELALSADTSFKLWLNGEWIHAGPMREVPPFFYYDVLDLKPFLNVGLNCLRVLVHRAGVDTATHQPAEGGLIVRGRVEARNSEIDLGNRSDWKVRRSPTFGSDAPRLGSAIGFAESVNLTVPPEAWLRDEAPAGATTPEIRAVFPRGKLTQPLPRGFPAFTGGSFSGARVPSAGLGQIWDLGREVFGYVTINFGEGTPTPLVIAYAEHLSDGKVDEKKAGMDYRDRLLLPAGSRTWTSFEKRGFRYLEVRGPDRVQAVSVREFGYPYERVFSKPPEPTDTPIIEMAARSIELCSDDLLNDCVWRERAQYLDPWTYFRAMKKLFGTLEPADRYIRQMLRPVALHGIFPARYPSPALDLLIPDFAFSVPLMLEQYYQLTQDAEIVKSSFKAAAQALLWYDRFRDATGLLANPPGWTFLDNTFDLNKGPKSSGLNAVYYEALTALSRLAKITGDTLSEAKFRDRAVKLQPAWRDCFLHDGEVWDADSSPTFAQRHFWNYHYPADTGDWAPGGAVLLDTTIRLPRGGTLPLYMSHFSGLRVWFGRELVATFASGGWWERPPVFHPSEISLTFTGEWQELRIELENNPLDWEVYIGTDTKIELGGLTVTKRAHFGDESSTVRDHAVRETAWRPYFVPRASQITAGYTARSGILETIEARKLLLSVLRPHYYAPWERRTTPFFVEISLNAELLRQSVCPCNTPMSLFAFCTALRRYGLEEEARELIRKIYHQMLARGATSCWEEWGERSSHCHAWGAFVADFLL